jgi:hypothetical protein
MQHAHTPTHPGSTRRLPPPTRAWMTVERRQRHRQLYTGSPGGKPPRKPLGTKTWRKPGQIYVEIKEKKRKEEKKFQNAMVKKIKE